MKKILSLLLISILLFLNLGQSYTANWKAYEEDIAKIDKLLEDQWKDELRVELKLFKLQRSLVNNIQDNYENRYKDIEKSINDLISGYKSWYISSTKVDVDINVELNDNSKTFVNSEETKNWSDQKLWHLKIESDTLLKVWEENDFSKSKWNIELNILDNVINTKFDFEQIITEWSSYLKLDRLFIRDNFIHSDKIKTLAPYITEEFFNKNISEAQKQINIINKKWIELKNKQLQIKDNSIIPQSSYMDIFTSQFNKIKDSIKQEKINEVFTLLKEEKIFHVYKKSGNDKYYLLYNNKLGLKINKILGENIFPYIKYDSLMKLEKAKENIIQEEEDGTFKYINIKKVDKKIEDVLYLTFSENRIYTGLIKDWDNIVFLNKNVIKFSWENAKGQILFADWDIKIKAIIIKTDYHLEILSYIKENLEWMITVFKLKQKDTQENIGSARIMYLTEESNERLKFNIEAKEKLWKIINPSNVWKLSIDWEYLFKDNFLAFELNLIDTSILPVNIIWSIKTYLNFKESSVKISRPSKVDQVFESLNDFRDFILK